MLEERLNISTVGKKKSAFHQLYFNFYLKGSNLVYTLISKPSLLLLTFTGDYRDSDLRSFIAISIPGHCPFSDKNRNRKGVAGQAVWG